MIVVVSAVLDHLSLHHDSSWLSLSPSFQSLSPTVCSSQSLTPQPSIVYVRDCVCVCACVCTRVCVFACVRACVCPYNDDCISQLALLSLVQELALSASLATSASTVRHRLMWAGSSLSKPRPHHGHSQSPTLIKCLGACLRRNWPS